MSSGKSDSFPVSYAKHQHQKQDILHAVHKFLSVLELLHHYLQLCGRQASHKSSACACFLQWSASAHQQRHDCFAVSTDTHKRLLFLSTPLYWKALQESGGCASVLRKPQILEIDVSHIGSRPSCRLEFILSSLLTPCCTVGLGWNDSRAAQLAAALC